MNSGRVLGDVSDLQPPVLRAWRQAQAALDQAKINYTLTSGYRSPQEQQQLIDEYRAGVPGIYHPAAVGQSRHQKGTAIDIEFTGQRASRAAEIMRAAGFVHPDPTDPVHWDYAPEGKGDPEDPTQVDSDPSHLDPRFNSKLQQVLSHMSDVTGVQWGIREGLRSQARQTYLYAQGRTRPGPQITWMQTPVYHGTGFAADFGPVGFKGTIPRAWWEEARTFGATLGLTDPAWGKGDLDHLQWPDGLKQFGPVQQGGQGSSQQGGKVSSSGGSPPAPWETSQAAPGPSPGAVSAPAPPTAPWESAGGSASPTPTSRSSPALTYRGKPASDLENQAAQVAQKYGLDPTMFSGVIRTESSFNPDAVGLETRSGTAKGLGQFIDSTWKQYGEGADVFDPSANLDASARYLSSLLKQNGGDWNRALASYRGATNHPEVARQYVGTVRSFASQYNTGGGSDSPATSQLPPPPAPWEQSAPTSTSSGGNAPTSASPGTVQATPAPPAPWEQH